MGPFSQFGWIYALTMHCGTIEYCPEGSKKYKIEAGERWLHEYTYQDFQSGIAFTHRGDARTPHDDGFCPKEQGSFTI